MNAKINNMNADSKSHISIIGSDIILDNIIFIINMNGMDNKKVIPPATNFLSLKRLKITNKSHKYAVEIIAIIAPTEKIALTFIRFLNINKYGMIKILTDIRLPLIPFLPDIIIGNDTTQVNIKLFC